MKKTRFNFSKSRIEELRPGLGLRLQPSGHRSFNWFRKVAGHPTFKMLGDFPEVSVEQARAKASELNTKLNAWKGNDWDGPDPFQRRTRITVGAALDDYCERHLAAHAKDPARAVRGARDTFARHAEPLRVAITPPIVHSSCSAQFSTGPSTRPSIAERIRPAA
ncbi:MAG: hypothetical protein AUH86_19570 [Acidobacteria bacterium 13_1_40CM_4_58_4]|nr:MAG: hypothetical protein AUH86_19570 [Acidobacteria bacterium 13_1_40CM_4_58_4]